MNKVILVIDDPMFCCNCPLAHSRKHWVTKEDVWICGKGHNGEHGDYIWERIDMDAETRPDWCPLKELPSHMICFGEDDYTEGYNDCLNEILDT